MIYVHRCTQGGGVRGGGVGMKQHPPRQIFEKLVNKNAIKRKIGLFVIATIIIIVKTLIKQNLTFPI
jgi:hypothetical protein